ncbi:RNA polymerase sigma factor, partial [Candidatus Poribacteria bacterium]|nr:RNA polymerase sigma factor [Candidatus Poribacteria bacterium]
MKQNDSELVKRTLEGDQQAYASLVEKYQEQIHALAWQKIGDFHIAQEITQDAFMTAYQKLNSLKSPQRFSGWLYVITTNICNMWHRKRKAQLQSLEQTDPMELEEAYYTEYKTKEREEDRKENQRSLVRKLLSRLKESDRTVVTLHYLAGLSCEEIGEFLGVSTNTVKSRLHRARNRLRGEEALIQENLSSLQVPKQLT